MQVLGFTAEERETINKLLASVLHLGNVYFHRKQLKHGQEGMNMWENSHFHNLDQNVTNLLDRGGGPALFS